MAREIQITPRRIQYAQEVELKLFNTLMKIASDKQEEICKIIQKTLNDMKSNVAEVLEEYYDSGKCVYCNCYLKVQILNFRRK